MLKSFRVLALLFLLNSCTPETNCLGIQYPKVDHPEMIHLLKAQDEYINQYKTALEKGNKEAGYPVAYFTNREMIMQIIAEEFSHEKLGMMEDYEKSSADKLRMIKNTNQ